MTKDARSVTSMSLNPESVLGVLALQAHTVMADSVSVTAVVARNAGPSVIIRFV